MPKVFGRCEYGTIVRVDAAEAGTEHDLRASRGSVVRACVEGLEGSARLLTLGFLAGWCHLHAAEEERAGELSCYLEDRGRVLDDAAWRVWARGEWLAWSSTGRVW